MKHFFNILAIFLQKRLHRLLDNESPDSNRFTLVTPKSENDVRLQATLDNQNHRLSRWFVLAL